VHAAAFARTAKPEQIEAVAAFFRTEPFARIGATVSVATRMIGDLGPVNAIAGVLKNRIVDIAGGRGFRAEIDQRDSAPRFRMCAV
jgi:hypothetical protein